MIEGGRPQALLATAAATIAGWYTVATTTSFPGVASRLVALGLAAVLVAVILGSRFTVGAAVLSGLAGAGVEIVAVSAQRWDRVFIVGALWFLVAELGWDSMERRDGRRRSSAVNLVRGREVGTVIVLSLVATVITAALADDAPPRTLTILSLVVVLLSLALVVATRHLARTGPD